MFATEAAHVIRWAHPSLDAASKTDLRACRSEKAPFQKETFLGDSCDSLAHFQVAASAAAPVAAAASAAASAAARHCQHS